MAKGPNDGGREVGEEIFRRMLVLRCDGQWQSIYGDVYMGKRRDNSSVARMIS